MGLTTIIRKERLKEKQLRLLVLGLDNAGKSSVVARWLHRSSIDDIAPTFGFSIHDLHINGSLLTVWDVGGQESIRPFWRSYYEGETEAVCFVVDASDRVRVGKAREELGKVLAGEGEERRGIVGASVLILVNKLDIEGAMSVEDVKLFLKLSDFSSTEHDINLIGCSALQDPDSCMTALHWIVDSVNKRRFA